jgi:PAS domain S-box-containing protein
MKSNREDRGGKYAGVALMDVPAPKRNEREDKELDANAGPRRPGSAVSLRVSEIRYRRLFEAARDGILILDPGTRKITDANPFMSEFLGYPHEELLGKELWEIGLLKDEEASLAAFRELQEKHFIRYEDLPLQTKAGQRRDVEFVSNVYKEDGRNVIQCNVRDITERKRVVDALRHAKDQLADQAANLECLVVERTARLQETVTELQAFSYSVSHDLRAPLRSMRGFAQILVDDYGSKLDEQGTGYLQHIIRSSSRLDRLIQDVLSYSRVLHAKGLVQPVDLDGLVSDIIATYPNGHKAEFHIQGKLPTVLGNEAFLTQCFSNLLANASKFVAAGTIPRIEIGAEDREPSMVRVWIEDNGIGIAPENHKRIFRMFERINLATEYDGTGIGLTIVRKAAERMGAQVGFESELGKGSRFWIQLRKG